MNRLTFLFLFSWISYSTAYYEGSEFVATLTPSDLLEIEKEDPYVDNTVWFVQFYNSSDDVMETLSKEVENSANATTGYLKWGAIDVTKYPILLVSKETPPWYQFYGYYKHDPSIMKQPRNDFSQFFDTYGKEMHSFFEEKFIFRYSKNNYNFELGGADIETKLDTSTKAWVVLVYDPNCEKCLEFSPVWEELLMEMREKIHFGTINNPFFKAIPEENLVYPTIKFYPRGPKQFPSDKTPYENAITYTGEFEYSALRKYLLDKIKTPLVAQILSLRSVAVCLKRNYCIFNFMPKLKICDSNCRTKTLNVIGQTAKEYKIKAWIWRWTEFDEQENFQKIFELQSGENSVFVVLNVRLGTYMKMEFKTPLTTNDMEKLVDAIKGNQGFVNDLTVNEIPEIYFVKEWKPEVKEMPKKKEEL